MDEETGCTVKHLEFDEDFHPYRIPYGVEERFGKFNNDRPCHDCNVSVGQYHHHGCDYEECPICGHQLISCGCF